ncbi:Glyoxylate/succinic semialdehyde reductase 2, chloroplastic [Linum grandiflorum]
MRVKTAMAICSSGLLSTQRPISAFPPKRLRSSTAFSAQASIQDGSSTSVGFLGLGIMGTPMAQNLLKAGCDVTVWNRTESKCDPLISLGAKYKPSPEEVAAACDVTFAMLSDPESAVRVLFPSLDPLPAFVILLRAVNMVATVLTLASYQMEVACGKYGAASGMAPGKGYVDVSTVDGGTSKLINQRIKSTGASFLEAPSRFYLGDVGNGAAMKLVVNMMMGSMMATLAEGLMLSEKVGLDPNVLVEVLSQGAVSAPMYSMKGPSMIKASYPTAFPLKHQQKATPVAAAANEMYKVAKSQGLSDADFSAVIESLKSKFT